MVKRKIMVLGGLMSGISVLFQLIPALFSELLAILSIFGALPVYLMSRLKPLSGLSTYFCAAVLIFVISPHEGLFFILTNGIIGLALGIGRHYGLRSITCAAAEALVLTTALCILSLMPGINVFGIALPYTFWLQICIMFCFALVYGFMYLKFADFVYARLYKIKGLIK